MLLLWMLSCNKILLFWHKKYIVTLLPNKYIYITIVLINLIIYISRERTWNTERGRGNNKTIRISLFTEQERGDCCEWSRESEKEGEIERASERDRESKALTSEECRANFYRDSRTILLDKSLLIFSPPKR